MRYYVYISETKVSQLYAQIPVKLRQKIAAKFTIDLKLIKAEFEGRRPQESLFSMLEIVTSYLDDEGLVGTVDDPKSYFKAVMPLSWGPYDEDFLERTSEFVYFGGRTERTIVGLGGSLKHVIGEVGPTPSHSHSGTPRLVHALRNWVGAAAFEQGIDLGADDAFVLRCVELASAQMGGPWEAMEFVAKRLVYGPIGRTHWATGKQIPDGKFSRPEYERIGCANAILGSPLYVSMVE